MGISVSAVKEYKTSKTWEGFIKANKTIINADVKEVSRRAKQIKDVRKQKAFLKRNMQELNNLYTEIWSILNNKSRIAGKYWKEIEKK